MVGLLLCLCALAASDVVFSDDFDGDLSAWTLEGNVFQDNSPANTGFSVRMKGAALFNTTVSTVGFMDVEVDFYLASGSLEAGDTCTGEIFVGGAWQVMGLMENGDDDSTLRAYHYACSPAANGVSLPVRFVGGGNVIGDFCYAEDVVISAVKACETQPAAVSNGTAPACTLPAPEGSACTLTCDAGLAKTGDWACSNHAWSAPTCYFTGPPCTAQPASVANAATPSCTLPTASTSTCAVLCDSGYTKSADWTCSSSIWSTPTCDPNGCSSPPIGVTNGPSSPSCPAVASGESCTLTCNAGYTNSANWTCTAGSWSAPSCDPNGCASPPVGVTNGPSSPSCPAVASGESCPLTCNAGYTNSANWTCTAGSWSAPTCNVTCVTPSCAVCSENDCLSCDPDLILRADASACLAACPSGEDGVVGVDVQCAPSAPAVLLSTTAIANDASVVYIAGSNFSPEPVEATLSGPGAGTALCDVSVPSTSAAVCSILNSFAMGGGELYAVVTSPMGSSASVIVARVRSAPVVHERLGRIDNDVAVVTISGLGFGPSTSGLQVRFGGAGSSASCVVQSVVDGTVVCGIDGEFEFSGGVLLASVSRAGWGISSFVSVATVVHGMACGDGRVDNVEACDDGNESNGDGCADDCLSIEEGYVCSSEGGACTFVPCSPGVSSDCNGDCGGGASVDACGVCSAGNTGRTPNADKDGCGVCYGGLADMDSCGICFGNNGNADVCGVCYGTNSTCLGCDGVPNSGKMFDVCGVCGGAGTSCIGCDNVPIPDGGKTVDACGVCGGSAATCVFGCEGIPFAIFDCDGTCNGTAVIDDCGMCTGGGTGVIYNAFMDSCGECFNTVEDECGNCPGDDSPIIKDYCGVCGGGNVSCSDCLGVVGGNASYDACGVCAGSNNCDGCNGVPIYAGGHSVDLIGVCGGSCLDAALPCAASCIRHSTPSVHVDCAGVCGGAAVVDECGVCSGGNTSRVPGASNDRCGVCFGKDASLAPCGCNSSETVDVCGVCGGDGNCAVCVRDACGVCGGDNSTCLGCNGLPIGGGGHIIDVCGECGGSAVLVEECGLGCDGAAGTGLSYDCKGICGGSHALDACMVCMDPADHLEHEDDCGVCFGRNALRDECGVCRAASPSLDDCGVCFGENALKDACGVCRGNNRSMDVCGVCFGDGTSCLGCDSVPFSGMRINDCGLCAPQDDCVVLVRGEASEQSSLEVVTRSPAFYALILAVVSVVLLFLVLLKRLRPSKSKTVGELTPLVVPMVGLDRAFVVCVRSPDEIFPADAVEVYDCVSDLLSTYTETFYGTLLHCSANGGIAAFADPTDAVQFAVRVQVGALNVSWPSTVNLASWNEVRDSAEDLVFRGPRFAIGIFGGSLAGSPLSGRSGRSASVHMSAADHAVELAGHARPGEILAHGSVVRHPTYESQPGYHLLRHSPDLSKVCPVATLGRFPTDLPALEVEGGTRIPAIIDTTLVLDKLPIPVGQRKRSRRPSVDLSVSIPSLPTKGGVPNPRVGATQKTHVINHSDSNTDVSIMNIDDYHSL